MAEAFHHSARKTNRFAYVKSACRLGTCRRAFWSIAGMQSPLPIQPACGTPEYDIVIQVLLETTKHIIGNPPWPDAVALLRHMESIESIDWQARWALKLAVERLRAGADCCPHRATR
jgi:hypothetical protein